MWRRAALTFAILTTTAIRAQAQFAQPLQQQQPPQQPLQQLQQQQPTPFFQPPLQQQQQQQQQQSFNPFQMFFRPQENNVNNFQQPQQQQSQNFPILSRLMSAFRQAFNRNQPTTPPSQIQPFFQQNPSQPNNFFSQSSNPVNNQQMQASNVVFDVVAPTRRPNILESFFNFNN